MTEIPLMSSDDDDLRIVAIFEDDEFPTITAGDFEIVVYRDTDIHWAQVWCWNITNTNKAEDLFDPPPVSTRAGAILCAQLTLHNLLLRPVRCNN